MGGIKKIYRSLLCTDYIYSKGLVPKESFCKWKRFILTKIEMLRHYKEETFQKEHRLVRLK